MSRRAPKPDLSPLKERKPLPKQKGGRHTDRKKQANKRKARGRIVDY